MNDSIEMIDAAGARRSVPVTTCRALAAVIGQSLGLDVAQRDVAVALAPKQ